MLEKSLSFDVPSPERQAEINAKRAEAEAGLDAYDKAERIGQGQALWVASGVDERHRNAKHGELVMHEKWGENYQKAVEVVDEGGILVMLGYRGNGKTQMAAQLILGSCLRLRPAIYIRCREIGMRLRMAYDNNESVTESQAIAGFVEPHLLVIDECQERPDKDWEIRSLTLILDKRYGAIRPTIMIANCKQDQFTKLMGSSVASRIQETGGFLWFDWPSFRRK